MAISMNKCKSCGAQIVYVPLTSGKTMPCNARLVDYYPTEGGRQRIVTPDGRVVAAEFAGCGEGKVGYISHFATCPKANTYRKRIRK